MDIKCGANMSFVRFIVATIGVHILYNRHVISIIMICTIPLHSLLKIAIIYSMSDI
jgi:hypothetical protein